MGDLVKDLGKNTLVNIGTAFGMNPDTARKGVDILPKVYDEVSNLTLQEMIDFLSTDSVKQFGKGLANTATGIDFVQTNENFEAPVVDAIRTSVVNALKKGRRGTEYEDYEPLADGTDVGRFVRSDEARKGGEFFKMLPANPQLVAATSVGRGSIEITDDGEVYFTDKYNFSKSGSNKGSDLYSDVRKVAGKVITETEDESTGNTVRLYMGHKDELLGRQIKRGDTLSKISKDTGVSVEELMAFNNIKNANKIKAGDYIRIPKASLLPEQMVASRDILQGDVELFGGA